MIIVDGKKFACQACIKGHRSTSCAHTQRTLVEIGKKGRPPTQCSHCRELRRTSKVHSKCMCGDKPLRSPRRLTVLPNGVGSLVTSVPTADLTTCDIIKQISNSCSCSLGGRCSCSSAPPRSTFSSGPSTSGLLEPVQIVAPIPPMHVPPFGSNPPTCSTSSSNSDLTLPACCRRSDSAHSAIPTTSYLSQPTSTAVSPAEPSKATPLGPVPSFDLYPYSVAESTPSLTDPPPSPPLLPFANNLSQAPCNASDTSLGEPFEVGAHDALFAPQTAGTTLCFCGIHCPCPGCLLHDPLGLKFPKNQTVVPCPTSTRIGEGCIGGLDLPTINNLLNLSPISENSLNSHEVRHPGGHDPINGSSSLVQLPSVSQALGLGSSQDWHLDKSTYRVPVSQANEVFSPSAGRNGCCNHLSG